MEQALKAEDFKTISSHDKNSWREIVNRWLNSGASQKQFCEKHSISHNTFCYWRGIFLAETKLKKKRKASFASVKIKPQAVISKASNSSFGLNIKLQTPLGYVFTIPANLDFELLSKLCKLAGVSYA